MERRIMHRKQPAPQNALDYTLRYVYNTFRNHGVGMAIEFKHGGRIWRADTPEEAIALRQQLETADELAWLEDPPLDSLPENVWTHDSVMELLNSLGGPQHAFLRLLNEHGKLTSDQLRR